VILYYALGGGLGHIARARRLLAVLGLDREAALLTASPFADDPRVRGELPVVRVPARLDGDRPRFRSWLADTLAALRPEELIVDSFPGGVLGELCALPLPPARHVARLLRWPAYAARLPAGLPRFETTYVLEPLGPEHARRLAACSRRLRALELPAAAAGAPLAGAGHWLVVHSGPDAETVELARYAAELRAIERARCPILVISPRRPSWLPAGAEWRDLYPAAPHLPHAERVITAAGFNAIHEMAPRRERHRFIPFRRALDDQFARAGRARRHARA
jgi:hypothetical protein